MQKNILYLFIFLTSPIIFSQSGDVGLYFNGTSDAIPNVTSDNINSTTTSNRTYELSFKVVNAASTSRQVLMTEGGGIRGVLMYIQSGYLIVGAYNDSDGFAWDGTFYRKPITSDTWYHITLVLDNTSPGSGSLTAFDNDKLKFYLDGTLIGDLSGFTLGKHNGLKLGYSSETIRYPNCGTWNSDNASEYCFGNFATSSSNNYFNGYMYFYRIWNDVRTPTEITNNMSTIITDVGTDGLIAVVNGDDLTYIDNGETVVEEGEASPDDEIAKWNTSGTNTNWNDASNWEDNEIPETTFIQQEIIIQASSGSYPIITSHIKALGDITINNGASITINSGGTLESEFDFINNGTVNIKDGGSLILKETEAPQNSGTFNVERKTKVYTHDKTYSYWSSPVIPTDSDISTVFSDASYIYKFDANSADSDWVLNGTTNFEEGIGYAVRNEAYGGELRTFSGEVNKGNIEVIVYNSTNASGNDGQGVAWSLQGDNLVGNPYPSAIDWDLVIADPDNSDIDGTMYLWNQTSTGAINNTSEYIQYTAVGGTNDITTGTIGTGQGFFIRTNTDSEITFKPSHQIVGSNTTFYRTTNTTISEKKKGRSWLKFSKNDKVNTLLIGFVKGATKKYDRLYDAPFDTNQTFLGFYSLLEETEKASIQGLPELNTDQEVVKLGYVVDQIGDYAIDIHKEYIDENYDILLHDTEEDVVVDLRENQYNFTIDNIGENNSRFEMIYKKHEVLSQEPYKEQINNNLLAYVNTDKELVIDYTSDSETIKQISIFNMLGNKVAQFTNEQTKNVSEFKNGIYILEVTTSNNSKITKKIAF